MTDAKNYQSEAEALCKVLVALDGMEQTSQQWVIRTVCDRLGLTQPQETSSIPPVPTTPVVASASAVTRQMDAAPAIVIFLQNPYSPQHAETGFEDRESWLKELWASNSGMRIRRILLKDIPMDCVWVDNTSMQVASRATDRFPPDYEHMKRTLGQNGIRLVVACGEQAQEAVRNLWRGPIMCLPHPTWRRLENQVYEQANRQLLKFLETGELPDRQEAEPIVIPATAPLDAEVCNAEKVGDGNRRGVTSGMMLGSYIYQLLKENWTQPDEVLAENLRSEFPHRPTIQTIHAYRNYAKNTPERLAKDLPPLDFR